MQKIIGVTDFRRRFRAILDEVVGRHLPYVLTRRCRPGAALIPYEDFLRFQELEDRDVLRSFDLCRARLARRNAEISDEELARDVALARASDRDRPTPRKAVAPALVVSARGDTNSHGATS